MRHNNLTELEAWLCFLASDNPADILQILKEFPAFEELYKDIVRFRYHPKELIAMYSDALRIMDENTVKYMVDEMRTEISRQKDALSQKDAKISEQKDALSQKDSEIERLQAELAKYKK